MSQWPTLSSGPLAGRKARKRGQTGVKAESQWPTFESGPLAGPETQEKESSPKSCVKICRLSYSLFAFGEVDQEGARIGLPSIV